MAALEECGVSAVLTGGARALWRCVDMISLAKTAWREARKTHRDPHLQILIHEKPHIAVATELLSNSFKTRGDIAPKVVIQRPHI